MKGIREKREGGARGGEPRRGEACSCEETEAFFSRGVAVVAIDRSIWRGREG